MKELFTKVVVNVVCDIVKKIAGSISLIEKDEKYYTKKRIKQVFSMINEASCLHRLNAYNIEEITGADAEEIEGRKAPSLKYLKSIEKYFAVNHDWIERGYSGPFYPNDDNFNTSGTGEPDCYYESIIDHKPSVVYFILGDIYNKGKISIVLKCSEYKYMILPYREELYDSFVNPERLLKLVNLINKLEDNCNKNNIFCSGVIVSREDIEKLENGEIFPGTILSYNTKSEQSQWYRDFADLNNENTSNEACAKLYGCDFVATKHMLNDYIKSPQIFNHPSGIYPRDYYNIEAIKKYIKYTDKSIRVEYVGEAEYVNPSHLYLDDVRLKIVKCETIYCTHDKKVVEVKLKNRLVLKIYYVIPERTWYIKNEENIWGQPRTEIYMQEEGLNNLYEVYKDPLKYIVGSVIAILMLVNIHCNFIKGNEIYLLKMVGNSIYGRVGESCELADFNTNTTWQACYGAKTLNGLKEYFRNDKISDFYGEIDMQQNKEVEFINRGTKGLIIDNKFKYKKIRILEGPEKGKAFWFGLQYFVLREKKTHNNTV